MAKVDHGTGLMDAMHDAARDSAHPDGSRLYEILAEAHRNGARFSPDTIADICNSQLAVTNYGKNLQFYRSMDRA